MPSSARQASLGKPIPSTCLHPCYSAHAAYQACSYRQHFPVIGKNGVNLQHQWDNDIPESYVGLAPENMPNFFVFLGPNGGPGVGSTVPFLENGAKYMIKCIQKLQREWYKSMTAKYAFISF